MSVCVLCVVCVCVRACANVRACVLCVCVCVCITSNNLVAVTNKALPSLIHFNTFVLMINLYTSLDIQGQLLHFKVSCETVVVVPMLEKI